VRESSIAEIRQRPRPYRPSFLIFGPSTSRILDTPSYCLLVWGISISRARSLSERYVKLGRHLASGWKDWHTPWYGTKLKNLSKSSKRTRKTCEHALHRSLYDQRLKSNTADSAARGSSGLLAIFTKLNTHQRLFDFTRTRWDTYHDNNQIVSMLQVTSMMFRIPSEHPRDTYKRSMWYMPHGMIQ